MIENWFHVHREEEMSAYVVTDLDESKTIEKIHISHINYATIEIGVGKTSWSKDKFKLILKSSTLLMLNQSRQPTDQSHEKSFEKLEPYIGQMGWQKALVKVTQPFNKAKFGIVKLQFSGK